LQRSKAKKYSYISALSQEAWLELPGGGRTLLLPESPLDADHLDQFRSSGGGGKEAALIILAIVCFSCLLVSWVGLWAGFHLLRDLRGAQCGQPLGQTGSVGAPLHACEDQVFITFALPYSGETTGLREQCNNVY